MILPEHLSYLCLKCMFLCGLFIFELPMKYFFQPTQEDSSFKRKLSKREKKELKKQEKKEKVGLTYV